MAISYRTNLKPGDEITDPIKRGLHEYNLLVLGPEVIYNYAKIAITAHDERGRLAGGLIGELVWGRLHVQTLWVEVAQRGQGIGARLLAEIEQTAQERGAAGVTLETTSFQARDFYLKNGYEIVGAIEGKPAGHTWYYMKKVWGAKTPS
jgi:ribosomal protein S18 acetylase RimI-like enzyme